MAAFASRTMTNWDLTREYTSNSCTGDEFYAQRTWVSTNDSTQGVAEPIDSYCEQGPKEEPAELHDKPYEHRPISDRCVTPFVPVARDSYLIRGRATFT